MNYVQRIAQITLLTVVLVFGTLLIVGSFNNIGWSDAHHGESHTGPHYFHLNNGHHDVQHIKHSDYVNGEHGHQ
jgi:hypothetical protein